MTEPVKCARCGKIKALPYTDFTELHTKEVLKRCGRCLHTFYCTAVCQFEDWDKHKKVCKKAYLGARDGISVAVDVGEEARREESSPITVVDIITKMVQDKKVFMLPQFRSDLSLIFSTMSFKVDVVWSTYKGLSTLTISPSTGRSDLTLGLPLEPGRHWVVMKQGASRRMLRENPLRVVSRHS